MIGGTVAPAAIGGPPGAARQDRASDAGQRPFGRRAHKGELPESKALSDLDAELRIKRLAQLPGVSRGTAYQPLQAGRRCRRALMRCDAMNRRVASGAPVHLQPLAARLSATAGHCPHPAGTQLGVTGGGAGLGKPPRAGAPGVNHDGGRLPCRGIARGNGAPGNADDREHGSGQPIHCATVSFIQVLSSIGTGCARTCRYRVVAHRFQLERTLIASALAPFKVVPPGTHIPRCKVALPGLGVRRVARRQADLPIGHRRPSPASDRTRQPLT